MTFVPYSGAAPSVNAILGAHVTATLVDYSAAAPQLAAGNLRALAVTTQARIEPLPDVPAVGETWRDFESEGWFGLVVPAKTPQETVSQLAGWFGAALQRPEVKARLVSQGLFPVGTCGADFAAFLRKRHDEYGRVMREASIKLD
jgi:tripartite-type tricarboxylate transporter receptor subunit TctC